ncbi:MBL fold metallo-hydrolase [Variovorax sp. J22R133]|uniref:MBL fold metallo-hydrolase n=1 Tax=Variovorax brevis TaxID=3053503 RepID=UPI002575ED0D|nr:MBL fold metallo-hydrolase [Variovorax sp. J22R133]MDM0111830.1 MBL fold metallo-hydrolase [Variovorax sp. J22R133]
MLFALMAVAGIGLLPGCAARGDRQPESDPKPIELAPGVYMVQGKRGGVDAQTLGRVGNAGFIVGDTGVLAIDTGTSWRNGEALWRAIRSVTDKPVRLVLITHAQKDFLFGANAFRERGIPVLMHRKAATLMASRCDRCLRVLKETLGEEEMKGTTMFTPDQQFDDTHTLDVIGRPVQLIYFGHSSGPGDVAVLDPRSGVLFAGGLIDEARVPDIMDGDLDGWMSALATLRQVPAKVVVPGHGARTTLQGVDLQERYLTQLRAKVEKLLRAGTALSDVPNVAELPEFSGWDQYEALNRKNASTLFVRLQGSELK